MTAMTPADNRLLGKVAVITGAGSGIGLAIAERFHAAGACVVLGDISGQQAEVVVNADQRQVEVRHRG